MTRFIDKSFSTYMGTGDRYRDNWDKIFKKCPGTGAHGVSRETCPICSPMSEDQTGPCTPAVAKKEPQNTWARNACREWEPAECFVCENVKTVGAWIPEGEFICKECIEKPQEPHEEVTEAEDETTLPCGCSGPGQWPGCICYTRR